MSATTEGSITLTCATGVSPDVFAIRVLHFRTGGSISIGMAHPAAQQHRTATDAELDAALESVHRDFGGVLQRLAR